MPSLTKPVCSVWLNFLIVLGSAIHKFRAIWVIISCCQNTSSLFYLYQSTGIGGLPLFFQKIIILPGLPREELNIKCCQWGSLLIVHMLSEHLSTTVYLILYWWVPVFKSMCLPPMIHYFSPPYILFYEAFSPITVYFHESYGFYSFIDHGMF